MQPAIGQVGGHLGQRRGITGGQRAGMRQREPAEHAVHLDRQPFGL